MRDVIERYIAAREAVEDLQYEIDAISSSGGTGPAFNHGSAKGINRLRSELDTADRELRALVSRPAGAPRRKPPRRPGQSALRYELERLRENIARDIATIEKMRVDRPIISAKLDRRYARLTQLIEKMAPRGMR